MSMIQTRRTKKQSLPLALSSIAILAASQMCNAGSIKLALDAGNTAHVVVPGQEDQAGVVLTSTVDRKADVTIHVEVESFDGSIADVEAELSVPAKGTSRWPLAKHLFGDLGIKWLRCWVEENGEKPEAHEAAFAYMNPAGPTSGQCGGFLFGIAYGAGPDNHAERAAERSALCGVKVARGHPVWPRIQPKADQWDWSGCDAIVDSHAKHGIEIQFLLSGAPRWSWQDEGEGVPTVEAWTTFCRKLAERYRGKVRFYELWNEPDIDFFRGTQEQYIELLRAGYRAIKEADPAAQVTTGGFASWSHAQTKPGMVPRVIDECQDSYDLIAYHRHGEFAGFRDELTLHLLPHCRSVLKAPKPLYFTETGMDTRFGQHFQAQTLPKKIAFAWANGAVAYTWFNLHDMQAAEHPRQPGFTYGLYTKLERLDPSQSFSPENMDYDHAWPKAVYVAYNTFASLLADKRFVERYALGREQYAFVFSGGGEHVVLAWNESAAAGSPHLVLATDAEGVKRVDLMGNSQSWPVMDGRTVLPLAEEPAYLVLAGGPPPRLEGSLLAPASSSAVPGRAFTIKAELWNPTRQLATVQTQWKIPEGLQAAASPGRLELAPGERTALTLKATVPSDSKARFGHVFACGLDYQFEPAGWSGTVVAPATMCAVQVASGELPKQPKFRLNDSRQVVNLSEHDPHTVHLLWAGRQDLSADVRLARVERGLKVQVDVQDNVHYSATGKDLTEGDCVELFLCASGEGGLWKAVVADIDGKPQIRVLETPAGQDVSKAAVAINIWGAAPRKHYSMVIPDDALGRAGDAFAGGVRLNVRVHDNDGQGHKGWLQIAPGENREDSESWPLIFLDP